MSNQEANTIYTIGHSTLEVEEFLATLLKHEISAVADVRSTPYSQFMSQFNREVIDSALAAVGVSYVFMGVELGARRDEPECYVGPRAVYERIAETAAFREGIKRIAEGARKMTIALMCAEGEPLDCHRAVLVSRQLNGDGHEVQHILKGGMLETHDAFEQRLLSHCGSLTGDLFVTPDETIRQAYERRGLEIAYVRQEDSDVQY